MIIERFISWVKTASVAKRAEATNALARAYLISRMSANDRESAEAALTILAEDPSPKVRYALADAFGSNDRAPRHIVLMLAHDQLDIAMNVLLRSPVLHDAELVELVAAGGVDQQIAIACRPFKSAAVEAAIAEVGEVDACVGLLMNDHLQLSATVLRRIAERHGRDPDIRNPMLARADLPADVRTMLITGLGDILQEFAVSRKWMPENRAARSIRDACDRAVVDMAASMSDAELRALAHHAIDEGRMTASFLLRMICGGNIDLFGLSLAQLTGTPEKRMDAILAEGNETAFKAVYNRTGLPVAAYGIFVSAMAAWRLAMDLRGEISEEKIPHLVMQEILRRYRPVAAVGVDGAVADELVVLLRRLAGEAARESARAHVEALSRAA